MLPVMQALHSKTLIVDIAIQQATVAKPALQAATWGGIVARGSSGG